MNDEKNQDELTIAGKSQDMIKMSGANRIVYCDYCDEELALSDAEVAQGWYVCPECSELSHLGEPADALDAPQEYGLEEGAARPQSREKAECGHCRQIVSLSARQSKQGWFICPACHELGQLDDYVTCLSCGSQLELSEKEWVQAWYRCPECDQETSLVAESGKYDQDALKTPVRDSAHDWVQLKTAVGPEEASLEVTFLRANGIEAYTWQQGAGRAYGLTVGPMGVAHVMVREDQLELARSLLEMDEDEAQQDDPTLDDEAYLVECGQCGAQLALSDQEMEQGHFICPDCDSLGQLDEFVTCLSCGSDLELTEEEWDQEWYRCPECDQVTQLRAAGGHEV